MRMARATGIIVISQQARHIMFDLIGFTYRRPFATCPYITEPAQQLSLYMVDHELGPLCLIHA